MSEENGAGGVCRTAQSIRRIMREYNEIKSSKNPYWTASPINEEEPYEWHFTVRGPVGTEFEVGPITVVVVHISFRVEFIMGRLSFLKIILSLLLVLLF